VKRNGCLGKADFLELAAKVKLILAGMKTGLPALLLKMRSFLLG
jgi:hypothetical protein